MDKTVSSQQHKMRLSSGTPKWSLVILILLTGCAKDKARTSSGTTQLPPRAVPADPWMITNLDANLETPALLWNGLLGIRFSPSALKNKSFAIDKYEQDGEEKIQTLASPLGFYVSADGSDLGMTFKNVHRTLDLRTGEVVTKSEKDKLRDVQIQVQTVIDPTNPRVAEKWIILPEQNYSFQISSSSQSELVVVEELPNGDVELFFRPVSNDRKGYIRTTWAGTVNAGSKIIIEHVNPPAPLTKEHIDKTPPTKPEFKKSDLIRFDVIQKRSKDYWSKAWQTDIEIDGPVEDQQFIRSALFYLRSSIHPDGKMSVSPMGLSSDIYNGHVFWDADIWVYPALALIDPTRANTIPIYRLNKLIQANQNGIGWLKSNRPTGTEPMGSIEKDIVDIAKFPWESSVTGKETVPGPSRFQDHISGSVAWTLAMANSLGLNDPRLIDAQRKVQKFYLFRSQKGSDGLLEIKGTMSPDEHHTGDNDLYTNLLAMWCTNLVTTDDKTKPHNVWPDKPTYKLPADNKSFLTYDNDGLRGYKQAAAVLSIYPLQYPPAEKQARVMMERFADKVTKNGPAMTDSIHSIIWARLGEKDKAYQAWHESWMPFVKPPFLLFSEKRNSSRTYFTTGAAGSLQAVLYGFAGIRIDSKKAPNAQWSMPLKNGQIISIAPNLPREWKKLTLRNLTILGEKYTFEIVDDKVTVKKG